MTRRYTQGFKLAFTPELFTGVLLDTPAVCVGLFRTSECPPASAWRGVYKVTPTKEYDQSTYFNLRVDGDGRLLELIEGFVTVPSGGTLGLHRLVVALAGVAIPDGFEVHHRNHDHLDNRIENLAPVTKAEHKAHHDRHPRLADQPGTLDHYRNLALVVVFKGRAPGNRPHDLLSSEAADNPTPPVSLRTTPGCDGDLPQPDFVGVNADGIDRTGDRHLERMLQIEGLADEPDHRRRLLYSKELCGLGLKHKSALRARKVLKELHRQGGGAVAGVLVSAVTAKSWSPRTAYNTLADVVRLGLVVKEKTGMYFLKREAFKIEPVKKKGAACATPRISRLAGPCRDECQDDRNHRGGVDPDVEQRAGEDHAGPEQ